jgi:uncharacterized membrane protein YeaQ/YmgE (transglycosylase-associated protein family)
MTIDISQLITWIVIGAIAGWLATLVLRNHRWSTMASIGLGLIGAIVGGILFSLFHIQMPAALEAVKLTISLADIIIAFIGAIVILLLASVFYRGRV